MQAYYGSHVSHSKTGLIKTLDQLHEMGINAAQIMVTNPMRCRASENSFTKYDSIGDEVMSRLLQYDFKLVIHAPYTLNFAKNPNEQDAYWIDALFRELKIAHRIGAMGCVLHMGKAVNLEKEEAENNFHQNLATLIDCMREAGLDRVKLLVETSAGQGTELYPTIGNLNDLARFFSRFNESQREYIGICVDTCHIFAAGYDISTSDQSQAFFDEFDEKIGLQHLKVVHMNNSTRELGCRVDRHACLQFGKIGFEGLTTFTQKCYQHNIPVILETPGGIQEVPILASIAGSSYTTHPF